MGMTVEEMRGYLQLRAERDALLAENERWVEKMAKLKALATKHYGHGYGDMPRDIIRIIEG